MRSPEYYRGKEQTYLKHFFLEQYLETVAFHIGYSHQEFVYVDCFSGPWRAEDEALSDTSIRIALDRLNYVRDGLAKQKRYAKIRAIFVEKNPASFRDLQHALEQHRGSILTSALPGTFEENIPRLLSIIGPTFAFFFVDPTGWTGFPMDHLRPILLHQPGEVMVNLMYDFINRFLNYADPTNEQSMDRCFGTSEWRTARHAHGREAAIVDLYAEQLRATGGFPYVTSTRILKPLSERAYFHLIYATRSATGVLKFRDVEKRVTTAQTQVRDAAQRQHRELRTGQVEIQFEGDDQLPAPLQEERAHRLRKAETRLDDLLQQGPLRYETLQPSILEIPLVWSTDLTKMLLDGQQSGRLVIEGLRARERTPKKGCTIRLREIGQ